MVISIEALIDIKVAMEEDFALLPNHFLGQQFLCSNILVIHKLLYGMSYVMKVYKINKKENEKKRNNKFRGKDIIFCHKILI